MLTKIFKTIKTDIFFAKSLTLLVILYPLLSVYAIEQVTLGTVCVFLLMLIIILTKLKVSLKWPKYFWLFFTYMFLSRFLFAPDYNINSLFSLSLISFAILLGLSCKYFDLQYGIKVYEIVVLICICFFFIQEIMYFEFGYRMVGLLPWIPLNVGPSNIEYITRFRYEPRSATFFLEPAHFAEYIIPLLAIELFNKNNKKIINFYVILISVVILLLRSGTGALLMALIWVFWFFYKLRNSSFLNKLLLIFLIVPGIVFSIYYYVNSEMGKELTKRSSEFTGDSKSASAFIRIIRGFEFFADFPVTNKLFGINSPAKIKSFISANGLDLIFSEGDLSFSCIQSILVYGGIIGMFIYLIHFKYLLKKNCIEGKMVAVAFIGLSIISPIYLMGGMLLCYTLIYSYQQQYFIKERLG